MSIVRFNQLRYDKVVEIEQIEVESTNRPDVTHKYRKALFFLIREGLVRTLDKIRSKKDKEFSTSNYLTKIVVSHQGENLVNYSTQTSREKDHFVVDNRFYKYDGEIFGETLHYNQYCRAETAGRTYYELAVEESTTAPVKEDKGVFVYGLGDYSRVYIAPNLSKSAKMFCVDYSYQLAKNYAEKFGYKNFGLVPKDSYPYLENTVYPLAIIATYHSDHTRIAKEIFKKNEDTIIFIEKPPCVTITDIDDLIGLYNSGAKLEIGYNRRYIPICRTIRKRIFQHQKVITISVKEILISKNHWYFWENQGTRITGNLTHWIDLSNYWIKGHPIEINLLDSNSEDETLSASILYSEGSLVNLTVSDKGNSLRGVQEFIEIRTKDETYFIKDFVSVTTYHKTGKKSISKKRIRNKGHDKMYIDLLSTYKNRARAFYEKEDMIKTGLTTFFMSKMYRENIRNLNIARDMDVYLKK